MRDRGRLWVLRIFCNHVLRPAQAFLRTFQHAVATSHQAMAAAARVRPPRKATEQRHFIGQLTREHGHVRQPCR